MYAHTTVWSCLLAFACKSLCPVCLSRAIIVVVLIFDVHLRDGAYVYAFYFEDWGGEKRSNMQRRGETAGRGAAACLMASGRLQLLLCGSTPETVVSQWL